MSEIILYATAIGTPILVASFLVIVNVVIRHKYESDRDEVIDEITQSEYDSIMTAEQ